MSFLLFSCSFPFQRSDTSWQEFPFKRCDGTKGAHLKALIPCHMYSHSNKSCPALHERLLISLMRWNVHLHLRLTLFCTSRAEGFGDVIITMGWLYPCMYQLCAFASTECHLAMVKKVQRPFMNREFRNSPPGDVDRKQNCWGPHLCPVAVAPSLLAIAGTLHKHNFPSLLPVDPLTCNYNYIREIFQLTLIDGFNLLLDWELSVAGRKFSVPAYSHAYDGIDN